MAKVNEDGSVMHQRKDPNDPRNLEKGQVLPNLEDPEADPTPVAKSEVETDQGVQHIGKDPNDPRAVGKPEMVSLKTGHAADAKE